jgi:hypothetical protein
MKGPGHYNPALFSLFAASLVQPANALVGGRDEVLGSIEVT